jgi:hypothetical protein
MLAFTVAFILETVVLSHQLWARLSVGVILALMTLLISWYLWIMTEAGSVFSVFEGVQHLKYWLFEFSRGLRGITAELGSGPGNGRDGDHLGRNRGPPRSRTSKEDFEFFRRRRRVSTSSALVNVGPTEGGGLPGVSDSIQVEMREIENREPESAV